MAESKLPRLVPYEYVSPGFEGVYTGEKSTSPSEETELITVRSADEEGNVIGTDVRDILGVSKTSYSVMLAYDRRTFSARLSYFWRDSFYDRDEAALFANPLEIWKSAEESLDFQLTWRVLSNLAVTFDAVNLTAPVFHENYGDNPLIFNFLNNYFSRTFALGIRYQF